MPDPVSLLVGARQLIATGTHLFYLDDNGRVWGYDLTQSLGAGEWVPLPPLPEPVSG